MADNQTSALAVISSGDDALSLVQQPNSEYRFVRYSASKISRQDFADDFVFGSGSAALQVEGAYAEGGRSLSNWDSFTLRTPSKIVDGSNTCVAIDQYHRYQEDVMLLKKIGFSAYRFSISWSRVLPGGRLSLGKNAEGIKYYNDLIDFCLAQGVEPHVTIFHFDTPQCLEDEYGGFLSDKILKDFSEFAELCFWEFGDRVKNWITINEALAYSSNGYAYGAFPPGRGDAAKTDSSTEPYIVGHNLILAHAAAVDVYRRNYQAVQGGKIGMTNVASWNEPLDEDDPNDKEAADRATDFSMGWFVEPLVTGQYPESMRKYVGDRLPKFTKEQEILVKGSFDYLGFNYYTARYVQNNPTPASTDSPYTADMHITSLTERHGVPIGPVATGSPWLFIVPWGLHSILKYIKNKYGDPVIYITENGVSEANDTTLTVTEALVDDTRIRFIQDHLYYVKKSIDEDKVKVKTYFVWSLLDNFELSYGYTSRFGLIYVDYVNGLTRHPKKSAVWMMNFLNKKLNVASRKRAHAGDEEAEFIGLPKRVK